MPFPAGKYPLHPPPPPATAAATPRGEHSSLLPPTQTATFSLGFGFGAAKKPAGGAPALPWARPRTRAQTADTPASKNVFGICLAKTRARAHTVACIASARRLSLKRTLSGLYEGRDGGDDGRGGGNRAVVSDGDERP